MLAEDVDQVTGLSVTPAITVPIPEPEEGKQLEILWDLTHGVYLQYEPSGYFSNLTAVFAGAGFGMNTTTLGVNNIDLTVYDVVVINLTWAWDSPYQAAEVTALTDYSVNVFTYLSGYSMVLEPDTWGAIKATND